MPINVNDQEYIAAEREFHESKNPAEQLNFLKIMISHAPGHKGAENLRAQLNLKRKKLEEQIVKQKKTGKTSKTGIKKEDMQVMLLGKTNSGKSSVMNALTKTRTAVGEYPFTTKEPTVKMMPYATTQVQLVENPALESEYYDKGLPHTTDTILVVVSSIQQLNEILPETRKHKKKEIIVFNKIDLLTESEKRKLKAYLQSNKYHFVMVSAYTEEGIEELKEKIFATFDVLRIYTKEPGKETAQRPMILLPNSTVENAAEKILKGLSKKIKETRIYGPSAKYLGQIVGLKHKLKDLDVIEFKMR